MTVEKALEILYLMKWGVKCGEQTEAFEMAIEALQKQVPVKQKKNKSYVRFCPKCEAVLTASYKYCDECGQRIDWSDVK